MAAESGKGISLLMPNRPVSFNEFSEWILSIAPKAHSKVGPVVIKGIYQKIVSQSVGSPCSSDKYKLNPSAVLPFWKFAISKKIAVAPS